MLRWTKSSHENEIKKLSMGADPKKPIKAKAKIELPSFNDPSERKYKLGDRWRNDFDYDGMLKMGLKANVSWGDKKLEKLYNSFSDVNYHLQATFIWDAVIALRLGKKEIAEAKIKDLHESIKAELNN